MSTAPRFQEMYIHFELDGSAIRDDQSSKIETSNKSCCVRKMNRSIETLEERTWKRAIQ